MIWATILGENTYVVAVKVADMNALGADKVITPGLTAADTAEWAGNSWAVSPPTMLQPPALACVAV